MSKERILAAAAAVLLLASLAFPFWSAAMKAPTYPEGDLQLRLYSYKYDGDIDEWNRVGRLVGVKVPPPIPDGFFPAFSGAVVAAAALAILSVFKTGLLRVATVFPWLVLAALGAWGQYSLYLFGHNLDPQRPLRYLDPFTPPIVGVITLGKIQTFHFPNLGSLLFMIGAFLLLLAAWRAGSLPLPFQSRRSSHSAVAVEAR